MTLRFVTTNDRVRFRWPSMVVAGVPTLTSTWILLTGVVSWLVSVLLLRERM